MLKFRVRTFLSFICFLSLFALTACVTEKQVIGERPKASDASARANNSAQRAISYMELNQFETAEDILKKALKESPKHSIANYTFALLKLRLGESKKADKYFLRAVNNDKNNSTAAHDYGYYLCQLKRYDKAIDMFDLAISNPLFINKGLSYLRAGECIFNKDKDRSEKYLLAAYNDNKLLSVALYRLAELHYSKNDAFKARAYYQRYAAVQEDSAPALYLAYRIELLYGADQEALEYRSKLLEKFPGSKEAVKVRIKRDTKNG